MGTNSLFNTDEADIEQGLYLGASKHPRTGPARAASPGPMGLEEHLHQAASVTSTLPPRLTNQSSPASPQAQGPGVSWGHGFMQIHFHSPPHTHLHFPSAEGLSTKCTYSAFMHELNVLKYTDRATFL